jgi:nucleoside-diphosphate-sugar epimerase
MSKVLVTGGSGFIATHCILQLLAAGHEVRTTVRNLKREPDVRAMLKQGGADPGPPATGLGRWGGDPGNRLSFFAADLQSDVGWPQAVAACDYVLHVASPFPAELPKHEDDLIIPAREGALRVLRASRDAGVKRVVLTSSFAAIGYGHAPQAAPFDETNWTNLNGEGLTPYVKSKTIAEHAAWDFIAREGGCLDLSVVNPVAVFGPILSHDYSPSILIVEKLLDGSMPGCPRLIFGCVDVRDVADLHLRAMTNPAAKGERFLAVAGDFISMLDIAKAIKQHLGAEASRVPTRELPNWLLRTLSLFDSRIKQILPELGKRKNGTSEKARRVLGWAPRSNEESVVATGESLVRLGLLKGSARKSGATDVQ